MLVFLCPPCRCGAASGVSPVDYLPPDKQYLLTRAVPCATRVSELYGTATTSSASGSSRRGEREGESDGVTDDGFSLMGEVTAARDVGVASAASKEDVAASDGSEDIPDMESYSDGEGDADDFGESADNAVAATDAGVRQAGEGSKKGAATRQSDGLVHTRSYDLSLTYDRYYQTPKVWLFGYDEAGAPLPTDEIFADISTDHARQTVTVDTHPLASPSPWAFIHPCRHATTMQGLVARSREAGREPRVDLYLFIFLKFISSVIPTIEYDFTFDLAM